MKLCISRSSPLTVQKASMFLLNFHFPGCLSACTMCKHILHTFPVAQQTYSFTPKWRIISQSQCEWPKANKIPLWLKCYHVHVRIQNKYKKPPGPNCFKNPGPLLLWSTKPETSTQDWTRSPEEQQHRLGKGLEIVVPVDLVVISHGHFPKHLEREIVRGKRKNFIIWRKKKALHMWI